MERLKKLYQLNSAFFNCVICWLLVISILVCCLPRIQAFQLINSQHSLTADYFFTIITQFGDGIFVIALAFLLFFVSSRRLGVAIAVTYIGSGLICSLLKRTFKAFRPAYFLKDDPDFHSVSWLKLAHHNAFPSGHTTSAFALACAIAIFAKNKTWGLIAFPLAALTAYSRVYLGQHFIDDVWFGSMLGTSFTCLYALTLQFSAEKKLSPATFIPPSFKL